MFAGEKEEEEEEGLGSAASFAPRKRAMKEKGGRDRAVRAASCWREGMEENPRRGLRLGIERCRWRLCRPLAEGTNEGGGLLWNESSGLVLHK